MTRDTINHTLLRDQTQTPERIREQRTTYQKLGKSLDEKENHCLPLAYISSFFCCDLFNIKGPLVTHSAGSVVSSAIKKYRIMKICEYQDVSFSDL